MSAKTVFAITVLAAALTSQTALAASSQLATVVLSQSCDYILLNSSHGMVLVKQLKGQSPHAGDTLSGDLSAGDFSQLQNTRNKAALSVWVDLVDPHSNKAISEYSRHCQS
ncbi:hypothetical protein A11A3_01762 [Alcanivorax hongdengensis A-11-3]|uniref:Uncharacterized protein n=1 Tax=Alcanivorax hongdengensis A-11-3 TaxID=1177179 RepID=L0WFS6_9GAMM|nr:hypothetical protein [Alcanivorax hongdengensis]EKF75559.1 hypothetical protein A11A3_01762 [Alcanivorax hongdengensis A-11-3]